MRALDGRRPIASVLLGPLVLVVAVGLYFAFDGRGEQASGAAEDAEVPCAADSGVARAAFLMDFRKPLDPRHAALPGDLLRRTAIEMEAGTELAVYALSRHAEAPRTLLGRLCKTIDLAGPADSAKHRATDDCDLPAQARASARDFCGRRDALARRVDALAEQTLGQAPGPTYLVEALEATARDFGTTPGTLYVFSDLKQHSRWYSHAETPLEEWDYERMAAAWSALPMEKPLRGFPPDTKVRIHYVPRTGTTETQEPRATHQRFWTRYFDGTAIAFDDQPAMAGYLPESLVDAPTAAELAAYELERLRHSSALVKQERAEVERERADVNRERRNLADTRRQIEADREQLAAARRRLDAARAEQQGRGLATASAPSEDAQAGHRQGAGDGT
ncbi:MAG: hypothetical protein OXQ90_09660 [Gammaproteobacteria bacterium]|nr:hypothetical protein [Gammaproteobacteria bacterium]